MRGELSDDDVLVCEYVLDVGVDCFDEAAYFRMALYGFRKGVTKFAPFVGTDIVRAADQCDVAIEKGRFGGVGKT